MKRIRIMELRGTYKGGGGPDKTILLSAAKHCRSRFFVLVTYLRDPLDNDFQIGRLARDYGVPDYVEVLDRSMLDLICVARLNTLIRKHDIQIIHVHDLKTTLLGVILKALNPKVKIMHTAHGWIVNTRTDGIKQRIQYALLKCYPLHITVSHATRNLMIASGIPKKNIEVLYNSIDTDAWRKEKGSPSLRRQYHIADDALVVGTVGRLSLEKDLPTFLDVAKNIVKKIPHTVFFIVGDGKENIVSELKQLSETMGLSENIHFTGHRTDLINVYSSFDLFLMTSLTEGLPNTVLEAMALEIPVVATNVGGVPELIMSNETGVLCAPGDVDALLTSCMEYLESSENRIRTGRKARERICDYFDFDKRLKQIETLYNSFV